MFFNGFANDSLLISYSNIQKEIQKLDKEPKKQFKWILLLIEKAKKENNLEKLNQGYSFASTYTRGNIQMKYGDSLLSTALQINNPDIIGDCYLSKGMIYTNEEKYPLALDYFMKGYNYIKINNDEYLIHNAEYQIAQIKIYLGEYQEARKILKRTLSFFRKNHTKIKNTDYALYYIYSLISYIDANSKLGNFSENVALIKEGLHFTRNTNYNSYYSYFVSLIGTDFYYQKKYNLAIEKLNSALELSNDNWKHLTENYYLGLSYWYKGDKEFALPYLKKLDAEYNSNGKIDPQFRPAFEALLNYYRDKDDIKKQLNYINKLIKLDKIYEKDYKYLYAALKKEYDTENLKKQKAFLEKSLINEKDNNFLIKFILVIVSGVLSYIVYSLYQRHKYYKILYLQFISNENKQNLTEEDKYIIPYVSDNIDIKVSNHIAENYDSLDLNPNLVKDMLLYLSDFEAKKGFLDKDITLTKMASQFGTNVSYLSKVINFYKQENFLSYINTLRLNYTLELWQKDPLTRYYRISEISNMVGFKTVQSFAKNFREKYKISPKYFLTNLNENKKVDKMS